MTRYLRNSIITLTYIIVFLFLLWAVAALYVDASSWLSLALFIVCFISIFYFQSFRQSVLFVFVCCAMVLIWWFTLSPSNDRDWRAEVARIPSATIEGDHISVTNIRNFHYESENRFIENWETRQYDLNKLISADMFIIYWLLVWCE